MSSKVFRLTLTLFGLTLFINAWLLFWIQPLVAKMILPYLGGTPSVWNACMMFFQGLLLAGYLYAHLSAKYLPIKFQPILHVALLCLGLTFLPITINPSWLPNLLNPISSVLLLLTSLVFIPLLALNAGSPLLQGWFFASDHPDSHDPYFLFSISNLGCLFALVAYPFILEPLMTLSNQNRLWTAFFALLIILSVGCASFIFRKKSDSITTAPPVSVLSKTITLKDRSFWLLLALVPSSLLLGVTTHITTDIASVPLLWIIPLILYFITFIIAFAARPWISASTAEGLLLCALFPYVIIMLYKSDILNHLFFMSFHLILFFCVSLVLNIELVRRRPHPQYLTEYYLWIALGGFLGGTFNTMLAPLIFKDITEYPMMVVLALLLKPPLSVPKKKFYIGTVIFIIMYFLPMDKYNQKTIYSVRNFFGTSRVANFSDKIHVLLHGTTLHGLQLTDTKHQRDMLSYYAPLVSVFDDLHKMTPSMTGALVGLGAGVTACLAKPQDSMTFYEINPAVIKIANNPEYFTYLNICPPKGGIIIGDARLKLALAEDHHYHLLLLDAFSSDAIPIHLITEEAIQLYLRKLKDNGVILVHISNRYLDLKPVLSAAAQSNHLYGIYHVFNRNSEKYIYTSVWVMLTRNKSLANHFIAKREWLKLPDANSRDKWTDDYSNILRVIKIQ